MGALTKALSDSITFTWTYDFGDGWAHKIRVERVDTVPAELKLQFSMCMAGAVKRRQILQQRIIDSMAVATQAVCSPLQVDRVPQHDDRRCKVEAGSAVALLLETAVADFAQDYCVRTGLCATTPHQWRQAGPWHAEV